MKAANDLTKDTNENDITNDISSSVPFVPPPSLPRSSSRATTSKSLSSSLDKTKCIADTKNQMTELLYSLHITNDTVNTAQLLIWMDVSSCISAELVSNRNCVTASMDEVSFRYLAKKEEVIVILSQVNRVFRTSMEVGCKVMAENLWTAEKKVICSAYFTFVSLIDDKPQVLPEFVAVKDMNSPDAANDIRRFAEANERRRIRIERRDIIRGCVSTPIDFISDESISKSSKLSATLKTELILPLHANHMGSMFGGISMGWIADAAKVSACRFSQKPMTLVRIEDIRFLCPMKVGDRVITKAQVNRTFGSKLEVGVRVERLMIDGTINYSLSAYLTFATSDGSELMQVSPQSEDENKWFSDALGRKKLRLIRHSIRNHDSLAPTYDEVSKNDLIYSNIRGLLMVYNSNFVNPDKWEVKVNGSCVMKYQTLENKITIISIKFNVAAPLQLVTDSLLNLEVRNKWDVITDNCNVIQPIDSENALLRFVTKSRPNEKPKELLLLRSFRRDWNSAIISNRSINLESYPINSNYDRLEVGYSGFLLNFNENDEITEVEYILQLSSKAIILALEDLIGATTKPLFISINNFKRLVEEELYIVSGYM